MPAPASSIVSEDTCVVRIKKPGVQVSRWRYLSAHGQHGALVELPLHVALRLVEAGEAKLPAGLSRRVLRDAAAATARP